MALLAKKKLIVAKVESTYKQDPSPTQAIQTSDLAIVPLAGPTVSRNLDRSTLGNDLQIQVGSFVELSFKIEMAGSGTPGTAPVYEDILLGVGLAPIVVASTSVTYKPVSTGYDSVGIYFHHDGQRHKVLGSRGSISMELDSGIIPKFVFKIIGLYSTPETISDPAPDFSAFVQALPVNNDNTTSFSYHGVSPAMVKLSIDLAGEVKYRNVVGREAVEIVDRAPKGQLVIESVPISTKNWFDLAKNSTVGALSCVHGTAAGNIITVSGPAAQPISPKYGSDDNVSTTEMGLGFIQTAAGDDELAIAFT